METMCFAEDTSHDIYSALCRHLTEYACSEHSRQDGEDGARGLLTRHRHILSTIPYEQKQLRSRCWITFSPLMIYIVDWSMRFRKNISLRI